MPTKRYVTGLPLWLALGTSTWSGARRTSGSRSRSSRCRRSSWRRSGSLIAGGLLLALGPAPAPAAAPPPDPPPGPRLGDRRRAAARHRQRLRRVRRADRPVRDRRDPHRDDAALARASSAGCTSASACRGWPSSAVALGLVRRRAADLAGRRRRQRLRPARARHPAPRPARLGARLDLLGPSGAAAAQPLSASGFQMLAGRGRAGDRGRSSTGEPAHFHPGR